MIQTGCVFVVVCPRLSFCPSNTTHFCGSFPKRRAASRKMSGLERLLQPRCLCLVITTCEGGWTIRHLEALTPTGNNKGELMKFNKLHQAGETTQIVSKFHAKHYWSNLNSAYILSTWSSLDNTTLIKKRQIMNQKEWSFPYFPFQKKQLLRYYKMHIQDLVFLQMTRVSFLQLDPHSLANCLKYVHHSGRTSAQWLRFSSFHFISCDHHVHQIQNLL